MPPFAYPPPSPFSTTLLAPAYKEAPSHTGCLSPIPVTVSPTAITSVIMTWLLSSPLNDVSLDHGFPVTTHVRNSHSFSLDVAACLLNTRTLQSPFSSLLFSLYTCFLNNPIYSTASAVNKGRGSRTFSAHCTLLTAPENTQRVMKPLATCK